jgi:hypothetical protein
MGRVLRMGAGLLVFLVALSAAHVFLNRSGHVRATGADAARGELVVGHLPVT